MPKYHFYCQQKARTRFKKNRRPKMAKMIVIAAISNARLENDSRGFENDSRKLAMTYIDN